MKKLYGNLMQGYTPSFFIRKSFFYQVLLMLLFAFMSFTGWGATYYSISTNNWTNRNSWSLTSGGPRVGNGVYPVAGDNVIMENGYTITVNAASACASIQFASPATLAISSNSLTLTGSLTGNGDVTMTSGTLNIGGDFTTTGTFTCGTGTVNFNGIGAQSIRGTTYYNLTTSTSGTKTLAGITTIGRALVVNAATTLALGSNTLGSPTSTTLYCGATTGSTISGSGLLTLGGDITVNNAATGTSGANITCPIALGATRNFSIADDGTSANDLAINAIISGTNFGITKTSAGTLTLNGINTYTGVTTINGGTISVATIGNGGVAGNLGQATNANTNIVLGGGTLQYTGATASTDRGFTITAGLTATIDVTTNTLTMSGTSTTSTGGLIKSGNGTLVFSGAKSYTGTTTVNAGTLRYGVINALSSGPINVNGGTLDIGSFNDAVGAVTLTNGSITGTTGVLTGTSYNVQNGTVSAILGGAVVLDKTSSGTVTLSGLNTYTGLTTVNAGTLQYGINNAIASGAINVNGGTLNIATYTDNVGVVTLTNGTITGTTGILTGSSYDAQNGTISAILGGSGIALTKTTSGTVTISSANTYTGGTTLSAGTLNINNAQALGTIAGTFTINGGTINNTSGAALTTLNYPMSWGGNFAFSGTQNLNLGSGIVSLTTSPQLTVSANTLTVGGTISTSTYGLTKLGAGTLSFGSNNISLLDLNINAGTLTAPSTTLSLAGNFTNSGTFVHNNGTVNFTSAGAQNIATAAFYNLITSGGGSKSLSGSVSVSNLLNLSSGNIALNAYNLTLAASATISGEPFSATNMIESNGNGYLIRDAATTLPILFPIGSNGYYTPVSISAISNTTGTISANTEQDNTLGSNYIPRFWDIITSISGKTISATFNYSSGETSITPTNIWVNPSATWQTPVGTSSFGTNSFTINNTTDITNTSCHWTAGKSSKTYFSYQTGNWHTASTWTTDPGGTTLVGSAVPSAGDVVVILSGRTVTLDADVAESDIEVNINNGGYLNLSTFRFTLPLVSLNGQGTLQLASVNFPVATANTFVNVDGGTTEYNNASNFTLPSSINTYNHLTINAPGVTATQLSNLTLNGDLWVKNGTFRINDNSSSTKLQLTINGDVTVNSSGSITVGQGTTNTTTVPTGITGGTAPYLTYYEHFHRVVFKGNFTNNGIVKFTNLTAPNYSAFPPTGNTSTSGAATVYFEGNNNNTLTCNNTTDFYNLVLNKGSDQTYQLVVQSSDYSNFRIFGANTAAFTISNANPDLMKALWIRTGTLVLRGSVIIPSLTEGNLANSEYYIPANGVLELDGSTVIVLSTADDNNEANTAYSVSGTTGINTSGAAYQGLVVYGKLKVNDGYLSTRESAGLLYNDISSGQFEINGGTIDSKQFRTYSTNSSGAAYIQTGGTVILRGRFIRPVAYSSISDLTSTTGTLFDRADNGTTKNYGSFNLQYTANIFSMSGGIVRIYDSSGSSGPENILDIYSSAGNTSVTGGSIELLPLAGDGVEANRLIMVCTEATLGNLTLNRGTGCKTYIQLNSALRVLDNLTLTSGDFRSNGYDVNIGGNFVVNTNAIYNSSSTTTFNGTRQQLFTINGTINNGNAGLMNMVVNNTSDTLKIGGNQTDLIIQGILSVTGVLADSSKTISVAGNITNNGSCTSTGAGKIVLNGTSAQTIGGSGSGIFKNIDISNTSGVSLLANTTINGALTLGNNAILDISTYNLKLNADASIINAGSSNYIKTSGNVGDGGITKVYSATSGSFDFPLGITYYTPASINITGTPDSYGSITVIPVDGEHPTTTVKSRSLQYFWKVRSSGFTLGSATISHGYYYDDNNVATGTNITEDGYVAARYNPSTFQWTTGTTTDVDETSNIIGEPGSGSFLEGVTFIDGDYTAGDNTPTTPFGTPTIYYSRNSGNWRTLSSWSLTSHNVDNAPTSYPSSDDIVIIGNGHTISFGTPTNYLRNPNTEVNNCASLQIEAGGTLDVRFNPNSNFGLVQSNPNGNGTIKIAADYDTNNVFLFPSGDFSDFNNNQGTTELYTTNATAGTVYYLQNGISSYGNLTISPVGGSNIIFPNNDLVILGNCTINGTDPRSWFCPTWDSNYTTSPQNPISKTITIKGNLNIVGGSYVWNGGGARGVQNIVIEGDVNVSAMGAIYVYSSNTSQAMSIGGSLINNTTGVSYDGETSKVDFTNVPVTFFGNTNTYITNTSGSPITDFAGSTLTINKGSSQTTTLTCNIAGTFTTPTNNWLTLQNGTFRYERTGDFTISTTSTFSIPETAGFYINSPSNIYIANASSNTNDVYLNGKITLAATNAGTTYVGPNTYPANNNDIEYGGDGLAELDIRGGNLIVNGQIRRNPATSAGVLNYSQSGGTLTINGQNANTTNAKLEILNYGSAFNMSGGTLNIVRGGGGTVYGDLYIRPETSTVTGGTIVLSNSSISNSAQTYRLDANVPLYDLTITGRTAATAANAQVSLMVSPLVLNGTLTLTNGRSILNSNNIDVTIKGDFINNGTASCYLYGTNNTTFSGGTQTLGGSSITNFYNLTVNPVTSLTIGNNNTVTVNNDLQLLSGTMICGNNAVYVKKNMLNNATYSENLYGVIMNGTVAQEISGSGTFGRLELDNTKGFTATSDLTLIDELAMTNGVLDINSHLLSLGQNSTISGSSFSTSKMIKTTGVLSDNGIKKIIGTGASTFTYPMGVSGKYTPTVLTVTSNSTVGSIRINNVNTYHPSVYDASNVLQYYWDVESSGITGFTGSLLLNYLASDVWGTESNYVDAKLITPGSNWAKGSDGTNVDETNHRITFNIPSTTNISGNYTAGSDAAIPDDIPSFRSLSDGAWNNPLIWEQVSGDPMTLTGGPNGFIVEVDHNISFDDNYCHAYQTTINGQLNVLPPYYGHNLGTVYGNGTLYLESATFPAGRYSNFFDCTTGGTLKYGGSNSYTIIADLYSSLPRMIFTGSGTKILPDKDLTICELFEINSSNVTVDNSLYNKQLTIKGNMLLTSGNFTSGTGNTATVSFAGSSAQTLSNFTGNSKLNNLEINNASGLTLTGPVEINGNLLLTNGIINTSSTNILKVSNTAVDCITPTGGSASSYVNGPLCKELLQGSGYFQYPIGNATTLGNKLSIKSTETGTLYWTATYNNPSSLNTFATPLTAVNTREYWNISATTDGSTSAAGKAIVNVKWDNQSALTPLMTYNGLIDMRVAEHDGTNWTKLESTYLAGSNNTAGSAETTSLISIPSGSSRNYTLACVNVPKPTVRMEPVGAVCGSEGIPVTLTSSYQIFQPFTVNYTIDGVAHSLNPTSFPATIPTNTPGVYQLTSFTYEYPDGTPKTGVVDALSVNAYAEPTASAAGSDQSICGGTSVTLAANNPTVGSGLWSIVSGTGGTVVSPTSYQSTFNGVNGNSYQLRWTISNGSCTSTDDIAVSFPIQASQPGAFTTYTSPVCKGANNVVYTVPIDASATYIWTYSGADATITGNTNSVSISYGANATSGTLSVIADNGCESDPRTMAITVNSTDGLWTGNAGTTDWGTTNNWCSCTLPTSASNVVINAQTQLPVIAPALGEITINNLTLNTNASLTLNPGGKMIVLGNIINNGKLILEHTTAAPSSFINDGSITDGLSTGNTEVRRQFEGSRAWYIGNCTQDAPYSSFANATPTPTPATGLQLMYSYDTNSKTWIYPSGADILKPMTGYSVNFGTGSSYSITQTGKLFTGDQTTTVVKTGDRWNLLANPFPAYVDFSSDKISEWDISNIEPSLYVRTRINGVSTYYTINLSSGISTPEGLTSLAPMQAFYVKASTASLGNSLTIKSTARINPTQTPTLKAAELKPNDVLRISATNATTSDETVLVFRENGNQTATIIDSEKKLETAGALPQIYSVKSSKNIAINVMPEDPTPYTIPLAMTVGAKGAGTITLKVSNIAEFMPNMNIYLRDLVTGTVTDLRQSSSYTFITAAVSAQNRFELFFKKSAEQATGTDVNEAAETFSINALGIGNKAIVTITDDTFSGNAIIELYDATGKLISNQTSAAKRTEIEMTGNTQMVIVKVTYKNQTKSFKIMRSLGL